ncbi:MAG: DUF3857 domain-containing protein, partial [Chitinophagaceae bacterium]
MKSGPLLASLLLFSFFTYSQKNKDIPAFGKIDKTEIDLKECEFDKNAEAVVLFDIGKFTTNFTGGTIFSELEIHVRIKILTEKGLGKADIKIPFYSYKGIQTVRGLTAQTYNTDASGNTVISKVEKDAVYEKKINAKVSHQVFTFPNVVAGSIIEYKYALRGRWPKDWYFQRDIPVMHSRYTIEAPVELDVISQQFGSYKVSTEHSQRANNNIHSYSVKNLPGFRNEPYITVKSDYLQRLETSVIAVTVNGIRQDLLKTWPKVIKELMEDEDFGMQLKRNIPRTADLDLALKPLTKDYDKMLTIHGYVRRNMEYNGVSNIWAIDGVKAAWKEKKGTSGEINLILVNLLKEAGLNAHPVLVSTRENGRISTSLPGIDQFDKVLAHVRIGSKIYVLDGTEKFTATRLIPLNVMYSEGLVIEKIDSGEWGWEVLWDQSNKFNNVTIFRAALTEKGQIEGNATVTSFDYSRVERMPILKQGKDQFVKHYFEARNPEFKIENVVINNEDNDSLPLVQELKFSHPVNESGNYRYFSANIFSG